MGGWRCSSAVRPGCWGVESLRPFRRFRRFRFSAIEGVPWECGVGPPAKLLNFENNKIILHQNKKLKFYSVIFNIIELKLMLVFLSTVLKKREVFSVFRA